MKKLSDEEKKSFHVDCYKKAPLSERNLAKKYKISKGTVSRLKRSLIEENSRSLAENVDEIAETHNKTYHKNKLSCIDDQCFEVFLRLRDIGVPLNGTVIKAIALKISAKMDFSSFKASNGWLEKFKKRHNLSFKNISGESKSADKSNLEDFKIKLDQALVKYKKENVFNCDETALYYKNMPRKSFVTEKDECKGVKGNKTRITIMLTCSMAGEKLNPLVIGHFKSPRPLKGFNTAQIGVNYAFSTKAWMTSDLFKNYLYAMNQMMISENRKILLILDNAPSHPYVELSNVELMFLPKNTTSILQPLDMGVIKSFKNHYFNALINSIDHENIGETSNVLQKTNLRNAMIFVSIAWDNVDEETIKNCFRKGFIENLDCCNVSKEEFIIETIIDTTIEAVFDETIEVNEEEEEENEETTDIKDPRDLIKSAISFFEIFFSIADNLSFSKLKELMIIKIEMVKEWRKKFGYGNRITDYLKK
jgi:hypothetical protein